MAPVVVSNLGDLRAVIARPETSGRPWGNPDHDLAARFSCPVCAALDGEDRRCALDFVHDRSRSADNALALAEAMGFCAFHAALIAGNADGSGVLTEFFSQAIGGVLSVLTDRRGDGERLEQIVFHAERACPVCKHRERIVSATIGRYGARLSGLGSGSEQVSSLCFLHFCATVNASESGRLPDLAEAQLELMQSASGWLDALEEFETHDPAGIADPGCDPICTVLRVVAGGVPKISLAPNERHSLISYLQRNSDSARGPSEAEQFCPVCEAMLRTLIRRLESAERGARLGLMLQTVLPTCPDHLWLYARRASTRVSLYAVRYALDAMTAMLRSGIAALRRERERRAEEEKSVWFRRKNPSYFLGQDRKLITHLQRCQICEALAVARDRAAADFVERLQKQPGTCEREYGLCLRHFADAYVVAPHGNVRDTLIALHIEKLVALHRGLPSTILVSPERCPPAGPEGVSDVFCQGVLRRFSGWM